MVLEQNQIIKDWLRAHWAEIQLGKIRVFVEDESHLKGGDICGYGWANRKQRLEVQVQNHQDSQTYYGGLDCISGEMFLQSKSTANTTSTIEFVRYLQTQSPEAKILLIWDGAQRVRADRRLTTTGRR